jgi:hypothetical protein
VQDLATGGEHIPELGDVYVDVALVSRAPGQASVGDEGAERQSISGLVDRRSPAVLALIGQPGSGKSTLLAHAARRSARMSVGWQPRHRRVPILLALREQADSIVAHPAVSLPDLMRAAVGVPGREPGGWWERQLSRGRCLVLLDGLDEIARAEDRRTVADWIERQIAAYPDNHFVITSRAFGLPDSLTARADVLVVRPLSAEQVQLFLDRWYLAVEQHATGASGRSARRAVRIRARESAARLNSVLREHPALHDLAVNPLLLTMIAAAHRYRGALPDSRADLYGEICHVLLSRRDQAKGLTELLPWSAKQALLSALAFQMMRDHVTDLPADRVLEVLKPQLERFPPSVTGEAFLADIARGGLLTEVADGRYAFSHLTFQEYLAARHVGATPDLVESLAGNVSDPWWHETILLYAAAADASPIVRACLEDGTLPALTLAFDCDDASIEMDPQLRQRLDRERARAYEPGCSPEHRRLIAGVLAARLVRRTLTTAAGIRICARPVPADLYWLFLHDTGAPPPDSPCVPRADQPATGVWGTEAQAFVKWLNSITATGTGIEVRLPRYDELQEEGIAGTLTRHLPAPVTAVWTAPQLGLWLRPGQPHPHEMAGAAIIGAVAVDAKKTAILRQILTAAVLDVAIGITRDLNDVRALSRALAGDLAARADSEGHVVDLMHAHAHAIVLTYAHALDLASADAITGSCAADPDLIRTLGLTSARDLAEAIARDLAEAMDLAHSRAVDLAGAIDLDLNVLSAFDFDLARVLDLARVHAADLDSAYALARDLPRAADLDLANLFGLDNAHALDPELALPAVLGLPLRWLADGPLARVLLQVLARNAPSSASSQPLPSDPYLTFALGLASRAGVNETTRLRAALGTPLTDALRELTVAPSAKSDGSADSNLPALSRLSDACGPMGATHQPPSPADAAAIRAVALALAGTGTGAADALRTAAATVTLIEARSSGGSTPVESIVLALV